MKINDFVYVEETREVQGKWITLLVLVKIQKINKTHNYIIYGNRELRRASLKHVRKITPTSQIEMVRRYAIYITLQNLY